MSRPSASEDSARPARRLFSYAHIINISPFFSARRPRSRSRCLKRNKPDPPSGASVWDEAVASRGHWRCSFFESVWRSQPRYRPRALSGDTRQPSSNAAKKVRS